MADVDPKRSALMARIRSTGTRPEHAVRRALHAAGLRFRLHRRDLPGKPDIVLPRFRAVVFVHGCFWHQHSGCRLASKPKTRGEYWEPKLARNVQRDAEAAAALAGQGWAVHTVWECETRRPDSLAAATQNLISALRGGPEAARGAAVGAGASQYGGSA